MSRKDEPNMLSSAVARMSTNGEWKMLGDLLSGTRAMREASTTYIPQYKGELNDRYVARVDHAFLYPGFSEAVEGAVAPPFKRDVVVDGVDDGRILAMLVDADDAGKSFTQAARATFRSAVRYGAALVLVDFPDVSPDMSLGQEIQAGVRPYLTRIPLTQLLGYQYETNDAGQVLITRLRWKGTEVVPDGEWGDKEVETVYVLDAPARAEDGVDVSPGSLRAYQKAGGQDDASWMLVGETGFAYPDPWLPVVPVYTNEQGVLEAASPFLELAWQNIRHWQSSADQNHVLHVGRFALLYEVGVAKTDAEKPLQVSPTAAIRRTAPKDQADLRYVEHSGRAIEAGRKDVEGLEASMRELGFRPHLDRTGDVTATGKRITEARQNTRIHEWAAALQDALHTVLLYAHRWLRIEVPKDLAVTVYRGFEAGGNDDAELGALVKTRVARDLSRADFLRELQRRGVLDAAVSIEELVEAAEAEAETDDDGSQSFGAPDVTGEE